MRFKPSNKAYSIDDLPATRQKQFVDFFKTRPGLFFQLGGVLLLFALPFLACFLFKYYGILYPASQSLDPEEFEAFSKTNTLVFDGVYALCFLLIFLALAGLGRIIRQWAWGEGIYFWRDFGKGIQQNGKTALLCWVLFSLGFWGSDLISLLVPFLWVSIFFDGLCLLLLPFLMMLLVQSFVYSNPLGKALANSFFYLFKKPWWVLLFLLFPFGFFLLPLIDSILWQAFSYFLVFFLAMPRFMTGWELYCFSLFDAYTNQEFYPEIYQKGLRGEFQK